MTTHAQTLTTMIDRYDEPEVAEATLAAALADGHSPISLLLVLTSALGRALASSGVTVADVPTLTFEEARHD